MRRARNSPCDEEGVPRATRKAFPRAPRKEFPRTMRKEFPRATRKEFPVRRGRNSPCDEKGVPPCDEEGVPPCDEEGVPEVSGCCEAESTPVCQVDKRLKRHSVQMAQQTCRNFDAGWLAEFDRLIY